MKDNKGKKPMTMVGRGLTGAAVGFVFMLVVMIATNSGGSGFGLHSLAYLVAGPLYGFGSVSYTHLVGGPAYEVAAGFQGEAFPLVGPLDADQPTHHWLHPHDMGIVADGPVPLLRRLLREALVHRARLGSGSRLVGGPCLGRRRRLGSGSRLVSGHGLRGRCCLGHRCRLGGRHSGVLPFNLGTVGAVAPIFIGIVKMPFFTSNQFHNLSSSLFLLSQQQVSCYFSVLWLMDFSPILPNRETDAKV